MGQLIIWGAGGHARSVIDAARASGYADFILVDDNAAKVRQFQGLKVHHPLEIPDAVHTKSIFVVAVGDNELRARCFQRGLDMGLRPVNLVHPSAVVSPSADIGLGSVVLAKAVINSGASIGKNCIINTAAVIEHDCRVLDHVHVSPSATLGGGVTLESYVHVGIGASVLPLVSIGQSSVVGAGAVVLKSTAAGVTAVGVPARILQPKKSISPADPPHHRTRVLLSVPHMEGQELEFVREAFDSNWLSTVGPHINAFEREFGEKFNVEAVAVSSGTAAIHLGLRALGVSSGDTVFCSDLTFVASVNPIRYLGAEVVLIDSESDSWNMDPNLLSEAMRAAAEINRLPKAVVVVHLFGQCADMDLITQICRAYDVPILEDAAESLGATYKSKAAGTLGEMAAFSFNGNKMITTTGGGMLVSSQRELVDKARFWATQSRDPGLSYSHSEIGYNYRLSNVLAGIGRGQLNVLDRRVQQRRDIAFRYRDAFSDLDGITLMPQAPYGRHANWLSCFLIDPVAFGCSRDRLIADLDSVHVEARPVWKPMHLQSLYSDCLRYGGTVSEDFFERGICLPSSSSLSLEDQLYVVNQVRTAAGARIVASLEHALVVPS